MSSQRNSDPLPYIQVDRAVKPKANLLAQAINVSFQHALGSLAQFWELCGEPRALEVIVMTTPEGEEPEVELDRIDVAERFCLASGKEIRPELLATIGILEQRGDRFRVRGMSRYFEPIKRRIQARTAAAAGGRASAEARKRAHGTAQPQKPRSEPGSGVASTSAQATAQATLEAPPKRARSDARSDSEATLEAAPNTADSGQRTEEMFAGTAGAAPLKVSTPTASDKPPRKPSQQQEFFAWAQGEAKKLNPARVEEDPPDPAVLNSQLKEPLAKVGALGLERAWSAFLVDPWARQRGWPWGVFVSKWDELHNKAVAAKPSQPTQKTIRWDQPAKESA